MIRDVADEFTPTAEDFFTDTEIDALRAAKNGNGMATTLRMQAMSDRFHPATLGRQRTMLRTAMGPAIADALADPAVIEVMVNPDGKLWLDRMAMAAAIPGTTLGAAETERIIRLVASHIGQELSRRSSGHLRRVARNRRAVRRTFAACRTIALLRDPQAGKSRSFIGLPTM
ncbi:MAG: hypothetical protein AcusKO_42290 [Acuticoccus sp.]